MSRTFHFSTSSKSRINLSSNSLGFSAAEKEEFKIREVPLPLTTWKTSVIFWDSPNGKKDKSETNCCSMWVHLRAAMFIQASSLGLEKAATVTPAISVRFCQALTVAAWRAPVATPHWSSMTVHRSGHHPMDSVTEVESALLGLTVAGTLLIWATKNRKMKMKEMMMVLKRKSGGSSRTLSAMRHYIPHPFPLNSLLTKKNNQEKIISRVTKTLKRRLTLHSVFLTILSPKRVTTVLTTLASYLARELAKNR